MARERKYGIFKISENYIEAFNCTKTDIEDLINALEDWESSLSDRGRDGTDKYETVAAAKEALEFSLDYLNDIELGNYQLKKETICGTIEYDITRKRKLSRADRVSNIINALNAVKNFMDINCFNSDEGDEVRNAIDEALSELECIEFPTMFG